MGREGLPSSDVPLLEPVGSNDTFHGELLMRQEMYRLNTMSPVLTGGELFEQAIAPHIQHLPIIQAMT